MFYISDIGLPKRRLGLGRDAISADAPDCRTDRDRCPAVWAMDNRMSCKDVEHA